MTPSNEQTHFYTCGCCKRFLPAEAFYINKKDGRPSNYCKECRKSASRAHRVNRKMALAQDEKTGRQLITATEDPVLRRQLILNALKTVADSIGRKRRRRDETEFDS